MYNKKQPKLEGIVELIGILIKLEGSIEIGSKHKCPYNGKCKFCQALRELYNFIKRCREGMESKLNCGFYNKNYCIPCKSPEKFYECEMVKIGNQIRIDKFQSVFKRK